MSEPETTINDFVGTFSIQRGTYQWFKQESGYKLTIGRYEGDTLTINSDGSVDVTFFDPKGFKIGPLSSPACFNFDSSTKSLQFDESIETFDPLQNRNRHFEISLYKDSKSNKRFPYGVIIEGDPQEVGAWGADDTD